MDVAAALSEINRKSVPRPNPDTHHQTQTQQEANLSNKASKPLKGGGEASEIHPKLTWRLPPGTALAVNGKLL